MSSAAMMSYNAENNNENHPNLNVDTITSFYIPRVHRNTTEDNIGYVFHNQGICEVSQVDLCDNSETIANTPLCFSAFVHVKQWYNTPASENLRERIVCKEKTAKVVYNDPYFWVLMPNLSDKSARTEQDVLQYHLERLADEVEHIKSQFAIHTRFMMMGADSFSTNPGKNVDVQELDKRMYSEIFFMENLLRGSCRYVKNMSPIERAALHESLVDEMRMTFQYGVPSKMASQMKVIDPATIKNNNLDGVSSSADTKIRASDLEKSFSPYCAEDKVYPTHTDSDSISTPYCEDGP